MQRKLFFAYGVACHLLFLGVYAWMALFVGGLRLPRTIDDGPASPLWAALLINVVLIGLFTVPHSVMARSGFKRWWTRLVPAPIERSTYVLTSCVLMSAVLLLWRPIPGIVWDAEHPLVRAVLWGVFGAGWLLVPIASLMLNHFDLFGTRQVWRHLRGQAQSALPFGTPGLYRFVRHPLYTGWMIAFWAAPTMTAGHLLFAALMTAYMLIVIPMEERDLVEHFGETYEDYRDRTPALAPGLPRPGSRADAGGAAPA